MLNRLIAKMARREFARVMRFEEGRKPEIPRGDNSPRLLLYLHIPFCERLCPYCSFHRITFQESLGRQYFAALRKEILLYKEKGYAFRGVYVGGGTPTVMIDELEGGIDKQVYREGETMQDTEPGKTLSTELNRLSEIAARLGFMPQACEPA
ncbi:MAG: hypothetical protein Q7I93_05425 [Syntrophales bacterium]|nr:hypothetical protein [Syntrophales bacterium]